MTGLLFEYEEKNLDPLAGHEREKQKHCKRRKNNKLKQERLVRVLLYEHWYKPSIGIDWKYDINTNGYAGTKRIHYGKNADTQRIFKRLSNKKVRKAKEPDIPVKGADYRKVFDYWWIWI